MTAAHGTRTFAVRGGVIAGEHFSHLRKEHGQINVSDGA